MTSKNSGLAQLWVLVGLVVMAVALPVASLLVSTNQDNRNKATYNCSEVTNPTNWKQPCAYGWSCDTRTGTWVCVPSGATSVPLLPTVTKVLPTPTVPLKCAYLGLYFGCETLDERKSCTSNFGVAGYKVCELRSDGCLYWTSDCIQPYLSPTPTFTPMPSRTPTLMPTRVPVPSSSIKPTISAKCLYLGAYWGCNSVGEGVMRKCFNSTKYKACYKRDDGCLYWSNCIY
ncbi:hypothetical protein KBC75_02920 [Candidatus Shapirobacteria bacterium]|nr:hypothetical protein [Candidatus Shapirobacteria bacterium]